MPWKRTRQRLVVECLLFALGLALTMEPIGFAGEPDVYVRSRLPTQELYLSLRGAMEAAAHNNPTVLLSKERIEAAKGDVATIARHLV